MGLEVRISGADQFKRLAAQIKAEGNKGLGQEMARALTKAVEPLGKAIEAEAGVVAPSGYRAALTRSLKHRRTVRANPRTASIRLTTTAKGKVENRDLPALNRGDLRHPVFGRRRKPWKVTRIEPGFHDRAVKAGGPLAEQNLLQVLDDFGDRLAKG